MAAIGRQNQLEYFLQGSVGKDSVKALLERLKGLCDGASRQFATFQDHEIVYTLGNNILHFQLCQLHIWSNSESLLYMLLIYRGFSFYFCFSETKYYIHPLTFSQAFFLDLRDPQMPTSAKLSSTVPEFINAPHPHQTTHSNPGTPTGISILSRPRFTVASLHGQIVPSQIIPFHGQVIPQFSVKLKVKHSLLAS